MPKCCNKKVRSQFCPDCGKRMPDIHALQTLLIYLEVQEKKMLTLSHNLSEMRSITEPENHEYLRRRSEAAERSAAKWRSWAQQLEDLLGN